jgi:hypothetical protein
MICMLLNFFLWSSSSLSSHQQTKIAWVCSSWFFVCIL